MFRRFMSIFAVTILLTTGLGTSALASGRVSARLLSIAGSLEYVTDLSSPHYEVNGYVLLGLPTGVTAMVGNSVLVTGTEVTGPSIYMRRTMQVESIVPAPSSVSTPAEGGSKAFPAPDPDPKVTIPVVTPPNPDSGNGSPEVTVPVVIEPIPVSTEPGVKTPAPAPLFGTNSAVLFGRVQAIGAEYYVVDPANGHYRYWVRSSTVDLKALVGQLVGVVADANALPDGVVRYEVTSTVVLSRDLSDLVQGGNGLIFQMPAREIAIRIQGRTVHWAPMPIVGNGRTLVGLRSISEAMGATVQWSDPTKTATVSLGDREVSVTLGSNQVIVHCKGQRDAVVISETASVISGGRMMVPLRVLSEGLGLSVTWDDATHTIDLN